MIHSLAEYSIETAQAVSLHPHALACDNVNIIFVEQGLHTNYEQGSIGSVFFFFLNPFSCAWEYRTLCSTLPLSIYVSSSYACV